MQDIASLGAELSSILAWVNRSNLSFFRKQPTNRTLGHPPLRLTESSYPVGNLP